MSRTTRKRAADFLDDEQPTPSLTQSNSGSKQPAKKSKKTSTTPDSSSASAKKDKKPKSQSLTADGTNGVIEHASNSEVEITTGNNVPTASLLAEGLRTVDKELGSDSDSVDDEDTDQGAALLAGFDSDTEDPAEDKDLDLEKTGTIPNYKKTSKKLRNAAQKGSDGPGAVYVGRIPHGFYEKQMREYFSQFGDITRLRLSRNRRTGASKHFAFIEFSSNEVAKIVAETMDNYLMFGHILKCKHAPAENLHPDVWKGANKKFRKIPHQKLERQKLEAPKTVAAWEKKNKKEEQKRKKNAAKLEQIGYTLPLPSLKTPSAALEQRQTEPVGENEEAVVNGEITQGTKVKATEQASKQDKKEKKSKVKTTASNPLTEGNLGAQNAGHYVKQPEAGSQSKQASKQSAAGTASSAKSPSSTVAVSSTAPEKTKSKKSSKSRKSSDMGVYDDLSSIPMGTDAAGDVSAQGGAPVEEVSLNNIDTISGVADAELKKRKKDRKKAKVVELTADQQAAADVNEIAPFAQDANKKTKSDSKAKPKKVKGILKNKA